MDQPELVALYVAPGVRGRRPVRAVEDYVGQLTAGEWALEEHVWHSHHVLRLARRRRSHSLDLFWDAGWRFRGWYVNLQAPLRSPRAGVFDTSDHALDIVVSADRSWRWKDEDDLRLLIERGFYSQREGDAIRAEGERVLDEQPWPTGWEDWRPDPSWRLPVLPQDWEQP